jgi:hypothetical protein
MRLSAGENNAGHGASASDQNKTPPGIGAPRFYRSSGAEHDPQRCTRNSVRIGRAISPRKNGNSGVAIKKAIEGVISDMVFELQSEPAESAFGGEVRANHRRRG